MKLTAVLDMVKKHIVIVMVAFLIFCFS